ncbi:MAG: hypothetical protein LCI00_25985 [Chloroflexi bacterium]|nr:hypothetical protein [Chloroflexota bacterium]MCC6895325.1 hypothetical protein [Anaerolineae bacterium]
MTHKRPVFLFTLLILILSSQLVVNAQAEEQPAPEFLYRDGNHLVLVNGYTGETSTLPIEVDERDRFEWSPDGQYLLAKTPNDQTNGFCVNLYDVDEQEWLEEEPISCEVSEFVFTKDDSTLYYAANRENKGELWKYSTIDQQQREVYETEDGIAYKNGINSLTWSPAEHYLTFQDYVWIMGGSLNMFVVMNIETEKHITVSARDTYYANYYPIWSVDEKWFLMNLKDEYIESFSIPSTNHKGDVYLFDSETGKAHRITYTPTKAEIAIRWTDNGDIEFTEVTEEKVSYTLDQALNIEPVPIDQIIEPEPNDEPMIYTSSSMDSPDPNLMTSVKQIVQPDDTITYEIVINNYSQGHRGERISIPIEDPKISGTILIGWRPSDYPYLKG